MSRTLAILLCVLALTIVGSGVYLAKNKDTLQENATSTESAVEETTENAGAPVTPVVTNPAPVDQVIFKKVESMAPCSKPRPNQCVKSLELTVTGKLTVDGEISLLPEAQVKKIQEMITYLLIKPCGNEPPLPDSYATYYLYQADQKKIVMTPNCEAELSQIDELLKS